MATAETPERRALVIEMWIAHSIPLPPYAVGVLIAVVLSSVYLGVRLIIGPPWWWIDPMEGFTLSTSARMAMVLSALFGYILAVSRANALTLFRERQAEGLEDPSIDPRVDEVPALSIPFAQLSKARLWGIGGLCLGFVAQLSAHRALGLPLLPEEDRFSAIWLIVLVVLLFGVVARGMSFTLHYSDDRSGRTLEPSDIDLTNLQPLYRIGRGALRSTLMWLVGLSISMLFWTSPDLNLEVAWIFAPTYIAVLFVSAFPLLFPLRHARRAIRIAKQDEMAKIDQNLREVRTTALEGDGRSQERLAGLLAYRQHIEGVSEWPFEARARTRLWLYGLIPLGSWIAGALVERGLGFVLD